MSREYQVGVPHSERDQMLQRLFAFDLVSTPPHTFVQHRAVRKQYWVRSNYSDLPYAVRVFPNDRGFFIEVTSLPQDVRRLLEGWLNSYERSGLKLWDVDTQEAIGVSQLQD